MGHIYSTLFLILIHLEAKEMDLSKFLFLLFSLLF